ncbi:MAG: hypothetical protein ACJAZ9_001817 [Neolewinella sp.]|jgi:hypothetical protein
MPNREEDQLPGILRGMKGKGDGFTAPSEDYFARMAERVTAAAEAPAAVRPAYGRWLSIVASVLLLMVAGWYITSDTTVVNLANDGTVMPTSDELLAGITAEDIDAYLNEELDDLTLEQLYEATPEKK